MNQFWGALIHPTNRKTRDHRRRETACLADVANPGCWGIQRFAALSPVRETTQTNHNTLVTSAGSFMSQLRNRTTVCTETLLARADKVIE